MKLCLPSAILDTWTQTALITDFVRVNCKFTLFAPSLSWDQFSATHMQHKMEFFECHVQEKSALLKKEIAIILCVVPKSLCYVTYIL